jgi:hypothetical protein
LVSLAAVPEAAAEFSIKMGTRWEPLRYTFAARSSCPATGAVAGCGGMGGIGAYDSGLGGWQNLDLNPYVGLGFTDRFSLNISLDFGTYSDSVLLNPPIREVLDTASYWQLGFKIGMKLYLSIPKREQIAAYIWLDAFKYIAGVHDPSRTVTDPADRFSAALLARSASTSGSAWSTSSTSSSPSAPRSSACVTATSARTTPPARASASSTASRATATPPWRTARTSRCTRSSR